MVDGQGLGVVAKYKIFPSIRLVIIKIFKLNSFIHYLVIVIVVTTAICLRLMSGVEQCGAADVCGSTHACNTPPMVSASANGA